jgi:alpha-glucosidase
MIFTANKIILTITGLLYLVSSCHYPTVQTQSLHSPNNKIELLFTSKAGAIYYSVRKEKKQILLDSRLGFVFKDGDDFTHHFEISSADSSAVDNTWIQPWGESREVRNQYHELKISLQETAGKYRKMNLVFRVFNDGYGFRYEFPDQEGLKTFEISRENSEFHFPKNLKAWWIPAYKENYYESLARYTDISKMDTVTTPLTLESGEGDYLAIHEANLTDYAKMNLYPIDSLTLVCDLTPWKNGVKVYAKTPFVSPWRTMIIADNINEMVTSNIMLNLNEPSKIEDTSWIRPGRYMGIWWAIHQGKYTWSSGPKHGATTTNTKDYIDFAAANGFSGVLAEGWNVGWDGDWTKNGETLDFTKPSHDFDIKLITDYARSKGIELIGHHETAGMATHYENQLISAFSFYQHFGVHVVKTGYVNPRLDNKEFHDGQFAVRHYRKVVETAANFNIVIDNHEPVMPTGIQRTWPNLMTQEGVRGQEYDAWSPDGGNPPDHTTIVPFLRGLAGPMDFTPGTFNFDNPARKGTRVQTTIAKQLALYVVLYSPLQMASDTPENYRGNKALDFIKSVPTTWEKTIVPDAKIGDYAIFARKERNYDSWFLGCITDENQRDLQVNLTFLDKGATYMARIYADAKNADWKTNPTAFRYEEKQVNSSQILPLYLAPGGGCAIQLVKIR